MTGHFNYWSYNLLSLGSSVKGGYDLDYLIYGWAWDIEVHDDG